MLSKIVERSFQKNKEQTPNVCGTKVTTACGILPNSSVKRPRMTKKSSEKKFDLFVGKIAQS